MLLDMKNLWFIGFCICLLLSSCSSAPMPVSEKMRIIADNIERNGELCTPAQLERYDLQYNNLLAELEQNYENMTPEELKLVTKEIARYTGLRTRYTIEGATEEVKTLIELLPSMAEGFVEGFEAKGGMENIQQKFKNMLDESVSASEQLKSQEGNFQRLQQVFEEMMEDAEEASEKIDSIFNN